MTLTELLAEAADTWPGRVCLIDGEDTVTFRELRQRASRAAALFRRLGVGPGDAVAVWLPSSIAWVEIQFALARIGAAAVAINTRFAVAEVENLARRSRASVLVLNSADGGPDLPERLVRLGHRFQRVVDCRPDGTVPGAVSYAETGVLAADTVDTGTRDSVCTVFTSSGTTSRPKLVMHQQDAVTAHARAAAPAFGYDEPGCVILAMLPICGVFGFDTVMGGLAAGATMVTAGDFDAERILDLVRLHQPICTNGSDEMYRRIFRAARARGWTSLGSLRRGGFAAFSGDPEPLVTEGDALGFRLFGVYGSSEIQALAALRDHGASRAERVKAGGRPVTPELRVRVRDIDTGALCEPGQTGELEFTGPSLSVGYLHDEARTAEDFTADGWFRSGDLGLLEPGGRFCFTGRRGDAFRLSGFLTSPREIETVIEGVPGVHGAQAVLIQVAGRDTLVAFVVPEPGAAAGGGVTVPGEAAIIAHCRDTMAGYKVPRRVLFIDAFPVTNSANGEKIQRERLRQLALSACAF
ncbi:MAG TPA: AMP-binding protein [Trebonia sp.]|jgi:fatty-acyl-CoA synthase